MSSLHQLKQWFAQHRDSIREEYFSFLRFQSISADPAFASDVRSCAKWLLDYLIHQVQMKAEWVETEGHPLIFAEDLRAGPDALTVLIYGHYDVQPVDPLELWDSDPFEPTIRNGKVYARGAVDDKGQIFFALLAVRAWRELNRDLPINLKFCIEGEEESSNLGLSKSLPSLKQKLQADFLLVVDFDQFDEETAAISLGARGLCAFQVTLTGSKSDLHSGMHGGMAYNPNRALVELLAHVWDEKGRVQIPGFYEDVLELSEEEKNRLDFRFDEEEYCQEFGVGVLGGEKGLSLAEKNTLRPTFEINGISGGYTGAGLKTVIPSCATAKISCRLVPDQNPALVGERVTTFLTSKVPQGMRIEVTAMGGEAAFRSSPENRLARAVAQAAAEVTGRPCKKILSGGSIPIVASMIRLLGTEVVGMGYGLPTDNIHAPNEHFDMNRFEKGFLTVARTLELV